MLVLSQKVTDRSKLQNLLPFSLLICNSLPFKNEIVKIQPKVKLLWATACTNKIIFSKHLLVRMRLMKIDRMKLSVWPMW